jgi:hypothetical protein
VLVLAADDLAPIDLDDTAAEGFICEQWSVGPPDVREVVELRTLADGTVDRTAYVGSRAVTLSVVVFPANGLTVQGQIDRLRAFCRPSLRPTLTWQVETDELRTIALRAAPGLDMEWTRTDWRRVGLSFVAPDGLVYAGDWTGSGTEIRLIAPSAGAEDGRRYDEKDQTGPAVLQNIIGTDNAASAEDGTTGGWVGAAGAAITSSTTQARHGTRAIAMTTTAANPNVGTPSGVASVAIQQNTTYTIVYSVWVAAAGRTCYVGMSSYDSGGAVVVSGATGPQVALTPGAWTDLVWTRPIGADNSAYMRPWVSPRGLATDGSEVCYIDRAGVFVGTVTSADWALPSQGTPGVPTGVVGRGYDRKYPTSAVAGVSIVNPGDVSVPWQARIYGPCVNPALYNDTAGQALILSANGGLTLAAGESVLFDSAARTITVDGSSRYNRLDVARSSWWPLLAGDNSVRFAPAQYSPNSVCEFSWRQAWL